MKTLLRGALAIACAALMCASGLAEDLPIKAPADFVPQMADTPYSTSTAMTKGGTALTIAGRVVVVTCSVAGNVVIVHNDGSTVTVAVAVGTSYWPEAAVQIATSGTTATCSYWSER